MAAKYLIEKKVFTIKLKSPLKISLLIILKKKKIVKNLLLKKQKLP